MPIFCLRSTPVGCGCLFSSFLLGSFFFVLIAAFVVVIVIFYGEFDSGSGRTLAACLTHASRTERLQLAGVLEWRTGE